MYRQHKTIYSKFEEVKQQCIDLFYKHADLPNNPDGQVSVQTDNDSSDNWFNGIGKRQRGDDWEYSFDKLQPSLRGTPIDEYFQWLGVPVYRSRIMLSREKSSYSIHFDTSPRLHLPLVTNPQCNFLFTFPLSMIHLPADGRTTWLDTRLPHTFLNGSLEHRLHLVMIVKE